MAPKGKVSSDSLKQKSLMTWFNKPSQQASTPTQSRADASKKTMKKQPPVLNTPESKGRPSTQELTLSVAASVVSSGGSSVKDTPPTSDCIDVDMSDEEENQRVKVRPSQGKRKILYDDSDEEMEMSGKLSTAPQTSSPTKASSKKRKLSLPISEEDEDDALAMTSNFSRFKKSPVKRARRRSTGADEDVFTASSDDDAKSVKSASSRVTSSSIYTTDDEDEVGDQPKKNKTKPKTKTISTSNELSGGGSSFLTAAEQREQNKKDEKKNMESPYGFLLDIRDKDKRCPGDPKYDPRTLYVPPSAWKDFTPFERQFWEIKQNHYDTVLFFQKGKFFELYEDDARIGHQDFDLKLTQRVKMSMVGVPEMSFNFWAAKFLGKGYKVGRVDQAETALGAEMRMKGKGGQGKDKEKEKIVRRELHKVYTNGTLIDGEMLTDDEAGHCIAICEEEDGDRHSFGICVLDCATSQFNLSVFDDDVCRTQLETLMRQVRPKELLFTKGKLSVATSRVLKSILPSSCLWTGLRDVEGFGYQATLQELRKLYPSDESSMDEDDDEVLPSSVPAAIRGMVGSQTAVEALGNMIWYLRQLNIDKDILSMKSFNIYDPMKKGQGLTLDGQTLAHIEVLLNNEGTEEGTLLKLLNQCVTPVGKRLFRIWLCMPLREISDINARLDAVDDLMDHSTFGESFTRLAKGLPDLERIVSRIHAKNCKVRDFLKVLQAFSKLSTGLSGLANESESFQSKTILGLLRSAPDLISNINHLESMYLKPESGDRDIDLIPREGKDDNYDSIMSRISSIEAELDGELDKFIKKLGCSKMTWWHSSIGNKDIYSIETPASFTKVPADWTNNGKTKAKHRWSVPSLQKRIQALKEERENMNAAIKAFKLRVFEEFDADRSIWLRAVRALAEFDCLYSLAKASANIGEPSCRPEFVEGDMAFLDFKQLRHPTVASNSSGREFIPNDVKLGDDVGRIALLTGPNMAGKSTVMRMTATGMIMAQLGMHVPAESARLCPVDAILTRMGAYDNMFSNASTFKVELDECCKILRNATPKSLVILDELGRGTSTYDGMAIAGAVLHQLATHTHPLSFFATHYGSLTDDFKYHPNIRNMHMSTMVDEERRDIVFLFKLIEGVATSSFGTHVANIAGVPFRVVERADIISKNFAEQFKAKQAEKLKKSASARMPTVAQADFAYLFKIGTERLLLPKDPILQAQTLLMMKEVCRTYITIKE